ncbi:MAG: malectin [Verrucomicrobiota bacterium]
MRICLTHSVWLCAAASLVMFAAGCQTGNQTPAPAAAAVPTPAPAPSTPAVAQVPKTIRIKTGVTDGFTDKNGNAWLPDQGFADGETIDRPDVNIANASDPKIYQAERYSMTKFAQALPNGKYTVKLHFCETFNGITGPGQRVFSFEVQGHEFKDFDVWVKAGGPLKAYVETVPIEVTDQNLVITFTPNVQNPQINGIEIIPQ